MICDISSTLNLDGEMVSLLLRRYGWKTERLMENYLSDSVKCLSDNNLHSISPKDDDKSLTTTTTNGADTEIECAMCLDDVPYSDTFSLQCNHRFCRQCWTDYITSTINNKSFNSIFMTCPGHKCKTPLQNAVIKQFVDKSQWNKYENYMVQSYITSNENKYRFCPAPGCHYVIYCSDTTPKSLIEDDSKSNISSPSNTSRGKGMDRARRAMEQRMNSLMISNGSNASSSSSSSTSAGSSSTATPQKSDDQDGFQFFGQSTSKKTSKQKQTKNLKEYKKGLLPNGHNEVGSIPMKTTKTSYNSTAHSPLSSKSKVSPQKGISKMSANGHRCANANFYESSVFVQCRCGFDLCFSCLEEYHAPATCEQVEEWNLKSLKEADNAQWIVTNTKKCPKCFTRIERNHGCNHMVCTKCQYEFCWVCMGSWKEHGIGTGGYYRCNKYKPKKSLGNKQKLQQSEDEELDKFVHYFNRFHNHAQSRQFLMESAHKVLRKIKAHLNKKDNGGGLENKSWIDVEFLQNAHDEIFFCRQILKYTYVYAYYLKTGAEKDLFEFLQQDLEKNCEILHELCEQNWKEIDAAHIINYTNTTHTFVKSLLHGIAKGLTR